MPGARRHELGRDLRPSGRRLRPLQHRPDWLVPHFEKMLYDNALLVRAYAQAWQLTGVARYRQVVEETVGYLLAPPMRLAAEPGPRPRTPTARAKRAGSTSGRGTRSSEVGGRGGRLVRRVRGRQLGGHEHPVAPGPRRHRAPPRDRGGPGPAVRAPAPAAPPRPRRQGADRVERHGRVRPGLRRQRPGPPGLGGRRRRARPSHCSASCAALTAGGVRSWLPGLAEPAGTWRAQPTTPGSWRRSHAWARRPARPAGSPRPGRPPMPSSSCSGTTRRRFFTTGNDAEQLIARMKDIQDGAIPSANAAAAVALARWASSPAAPAYKRWPAGPSRPWARLWPSARRRSRRRRWRPTTCPAPRRQVVVRRATRPWCDRSGRATSRAPCWPGASRTRRRCGRGATILAPPGSPSCARATPANCRSAKPTSWRRSWARPAPSTYRAG